MYRQVNERAKISIEQGTDKVPADNKYHVINDGCIVGSFRGLKAAQAIYQKLIAEKNLPPIEVSRSKSSHDALKEAWSLKSNRSLLGEGGSPKGKKGGRFHKVR